jgi:hypothetical protein
MPQIKRREATSERRDANMKLKLDKDGNVVLKDGMPVYVYDDGKQVPFDAVAAIKRIDNLTEEKDRHFNNLQKATKDLEKFSEIKDPAKAIEALKTVENLDAKKLIDAGEVESLKRQLIENAENEKKILVEDFKTKESEYKQELAAKNNSIFDLMVTSEFAKNEHFSGKEPLTVLTPDIAAGYFGKHFKVENVNGKPKVVGYFGKEKILSRTNHGEIADFHEAIGVIVDRYPMKERILSAGKSGGGGNGNIDPNNNSSEGLTPTQKIAKGLKSKMR